MKNNGPKQFPLLCLFLCFIALTTCKKLEMVMAVSTGQVTNFLTNSAEAPGKVIDLGNGATQYGHCYATTPNPIVTGTKTELGKPATGDFTSQLTNLEAGTKYYIKAYLSDGTETVYGEEINFTTVAASVPTITTTALSSISTTTATSGGNITNDGGASVTARGVCWSTSSNPVATGSHTSDGQGTGSFVSSLTGLTAGTTYYVRAYATNSAGTAYGDELIFTTSSVVPTLTTTPITEITQTTATSGGNITNDGGASVTARGVCWNTSASPTITNNKTSDGTGAGIFSSSLTGLTANMTYYVRAYATNSAGTAYGNELTFTTNTATPVVPTLSTTAITGITQTTATSGGNITSNGGTAVTASGVCWSTSTNPVLTGSHTTESAVSGSFTSSITGLTANTTYYVRAYATNSVGTAYGNEQIFTTIASTSLAIGQSYQGGKVAYILQSGDPGYIEGETHGLIAAPSDQSTAIQWWNGVSLSTGAEATALGTGNANTNAIVASQGAGTYAAQLCYDLVLSGYTDWYLPSKDELGKLYLNHISIGGFSTDSFSDYYWSSTEFGINSAAGFQSFYDGWWGFVDKRSTNKVRAVRSF
ncbi:MAG: DUF1566 domain-containing protein [Bacteroidia bacterium]|nr:DUF1566 domain-containing protein [Bacteroidia bacterium]